MAGMRSSVIQTLMYDKRNWITNNLETGTMNNTGTLGSLATISLCPTASCPFQKHFRPIGRLGPDSSYSSLEIHICWNVAREAKMEPPIQTENFRSGGATTLTLCVEGASAISSFNILSSIPGNMVDPPDNTTFIQRSFRMSTSHFMMELKTISWMPELSRPIRPGWNNASGHRNSSALMVMTCPSGKV